MLEEPDDDGEVAAFVVGGEEDGVFVADCHCDTLVDWCYSRLQERFLLVGYYKERMCREMSRYLVIVRGTCLEATRGLAASWLVTAPQPMRWRRSLRMIT